jgi:transposase
MVKERVRYSPEVRERAVRMVLEHAGEYPSRWAAVSSVAIHRLRVALRPSRTS